MRLFKYFLQNEGMAIPEIFTDPMYAKTGGNGNFVLSTSFVGFFNVCIVFSHYIILPFQAALFINSDVDVSVVV